MATLGQLLAAASDPQSLARWLGDSPGLARLVDDARGDAGVAPALVVRRAVAGFSGVASEEDWAQLMTRIRQADDPGRACLEAMLAWQVARDRAARARAEGHSISGDQHHGHAATTGRQ